MSGVHSPSAPHAAHVVPSLLYKSSYRPQHPGEDACETAMQSLYLGSCLYSLASEAEVKAFVDKLLLLLADGGFESMASSQPSITSHLPAEPGIPFRVRHKLDHRLSRLNVLKWHT